MNSATIVIHPDPPPLRVDESGTIRIGSSRITLDLLVSQYEMGKAPEEIVRCFDALKLADVYGAIGYYLRHKIELCAYLRERELHAEALRAHIESQQPRLSRAELESRAAARK